MTDDKDLRLINTLIENYLCPEALENDYKFSEIEQYYQIGGESQMEYLQYIEQLPTNTNPNVLFLNNNAQITTSQNSILVFI